MVLAKWVKSMKLVKGNNVKTDKLKIDMRQMCTYKCHFCPYSWAAPYVGEVVALCPSCGEFGLIVPGSSRIEQAPRV